MAGKHRSRNRLLSCFACLSLLSVVVYAASIPKLDRSWKRYHNERWGYCVSYPSRWVTGDAFDGGGFFVETGVKKRSRPLGEIDIAALSERFTLVDAVQAHLDGLKKFERAEQMQILEKREMQILGQAALFTKDRYYDPQDRSSWIDEIVFASRNQTLYRLELECRADQLLRFEPVFTYILSTFQFDCPSKH
jgi:hypothetical protein